MNLSQDNSNNLGKFKGEVGNSFQGDVIDEGILIDREIPLVTSNSLTPPKQHPTKGEPPSWDPGESK